MCEYPRIKSTQQRNGKDEVTCFADDLLNAIFYITGIAKKEDVVDDEIKKMIQDVDKDGSGVIDAINSAA